MKIVIIGGVAGGASAAARARRLDESAQIILLERGEFISFANCGLPYYIGGTIKDKSALSVQTPKRFQQRFRVDVRIRNEATSIDPSKKEVVIFDHQNQREYIESYDKLILAPGAEPIKPPMEQKTPKRVFTLRTIPDAQAIKEFILDQHPTSAVIAGGGPIGLELCENLVEAGLSVTIVELANQLLAPLDYDMAVDAHRYLRSKGVCLMLGNKVVSVQESEQNVQITMEKGMLEADLLLFSVGVRPETKLAVECGIKTNQKGSIMVNDHMQTSIEDIYAVGDAVEVSNFITGAPAFLPLAGPANRQGRIAADHMFGISSAYEGTQGTSIVKLFDMTLANTGLNEKEAQAAGISYDKTYIYSPNHATYYPGFSNLSLKILWEKDSQRLIGAQCVGFDGVDKRMDVLATAIRLGAKATDLAKLELCYAPPYGSAKDPINMLGFVAENVITGKIKQFFWHNVDDLPRDGSITLLDLRTAEEVNIGRIDGFMNIPLDELREHLDEIPKDKPVFAHCHSGLRSYIACRILSGHGYDCSHLSGGWRLYESVVHEREVPAYSCTQSK